MLNRIKYKEYNVMYCPECKESKIKVLEKRNVEGDQVIRRRRECESCGFRFTTYERVEVAALTVVKKDGSKETFSADKLKSGIERALVKCPISGMEMDKFIQDIERDLKSGGVNEIKSQQIGDTVLKKLKDLDEVAYLRFASVYKSFDGLDSFKKELENIT